jgi:hypothetical protein
MSANGQLSISGARPSVARNDLNLPAVGAAIQKLLRQAKAAGNRTTDRRRGSAIHSRLYGASAEGTAHLEGVANGAIVPGLTSHTEPRHCAALDQRRQKPLLFEGVLRAQHSDLAIV